LVARNKYETPEERPGPGGSQRRAPLLIHGDMVDLMESADMWINFNIILMI
jgi:hypothetical protein